MADTTLNLEDLLKLAGVEEGFNDKNINVLYLGTHSTPTKFLLESIPKEFFFIYCAVNNTDYVFLRETKVFLFSSVGELNSTLIKKIKVLFP